MKKEIHCQLCSKALGKLRRFEEEFTITEHFRRTHPVQYEEIKQAYRKYKNLKEVYKFNGIIS